MVGNDSDHSSSRLFVLKSSALPLVWVFVVQEECLGAPVCVDLVPLRMTWASSCCRNGGLVQECLAQARATRDELGLLLREMVICDAHVEECR